MALYRCAACGSPNVVTDTQSDGIKYNYLKGAVGTVILGAGGAVAGVQNETAHVFKCPDCGTVLSYCMDEDTKTAIDLGVMDNKIRDAIPYMGIKVPWSFFVNKFKNIESGVGDELEAMDKKMAEIEAESIKKNCEHFSDIILSATKALNADLAMLENDRIHINELQSAWEVANKPKMDELNRQLEKNRENWINN